MQLLLDELTMGLPSLIAASRPPRVSTPIDRGASYQVTLEEEMYHNESIIKLPNSYSCHLTKSNQILCEMPQLTTWSYCSMHLALH